METNVFRGRLAEEAKEIYYKARHIKIPAKKGQDLVAEYLIHPSTGKYGDMEIVPRSRPLHKGGSPAFREDVIDLATPRKIASYDKLGCKILLTLRARIPRMKTLAPTKTRGPMISGVDGLGAAQGEICPRCLERRL